MDGGDVVDGVAAVNRIVSGVRGFLDSNSAVDVVLYGNEERVRAAFGGVVPAGVEVVHCDADNSKKTSLRSLVAGVNTGDIEGICTIGDTAKLGRESVKMRVRGIGKPTIVTVFPSLRVEFVFSDGGFTTAHSDKEFYVDAVDAWAREIYKQGLMASVYAEGLCEGKLRWGILSNGTERHKGSDVDKRLEGLIREGIGRRGLAEFVDYIGKVEPKDCYAGNVDVVLTDGYKGNLGLKMAEGSLTFMKELVKGEFEGLGYVDKFRLAPGKGVLDKVKSNLMSRVGVESRNSAVVLGYRAPVVKGHGEAGVDAIYYGICRLADCDEGVLGDRILERVGKYFLD